MLCVIKDKDLFEFYIILKDTNVSEDILQEYREMFSNALIGYYRRINVLKIAFEIADFLYRHIYYFDPDMIRSYLKLDVSSKPKQYVYDMLEDYECALEYINIPWETVWEFIEYYDNYAKIAETLNQNKILIETLYTFGKMTESVEKYVSANKLIYRPVYVEKDIINILLGNYTKYTDDKKTNKQLATNKKIYEWLSIINNWYVQRKK